MINLHCGEAGRFSEVISGDETNALVVLKEERGEALWEERNSDV